MADLREYRRKRDFGATPEPGPGGAGADGGARFVVHEHHARRLHWDLRLEHDGALASWAIPNGIPEDPEHNRKAVHVEDHPLDYIDFEGEIPAGQYGAGQVHVWDHGTYECEKWRADEVIVVFHGERLEGRYVLFHAGKDERDWMIHRMDPPQDPERDPFPEHLAPMLARLGPLPEGGGWSYEIKWDGVRALAYCEPGRMRLESRNGRDITPRYPELRGLSRALGSRTAVLDGEIVAFDAEGRPSFERLQGRMHLASEHQVRRLAKEAPVAYQLFDVLYLDGHWLCDLPYDERRARLESLELTGPAWATPRAHTGDGAALLEATRAQGLEGIVAKRRDSRYEPGGRGGAWVKVKNVHRQEVAIGGWTTGEGRRRDRLGALLVGYREGEALRYAGKVGTGFSERELDRLGKLLDPLGRPDSPFDPGGPKPPRGARFVEPELVAEVEFAEWTSAGMLRAPSYKGLRDDKPAAEVVREEDGRAVIEGRTLKLSNLDKVMYPAVGFTKGDVIDYYARIGPVVLPHLRDRPLTLKRYPDGVEGQHFYEKQCPSHRPDWVQTASVPSERKGRPIDYCLAQDLPTLVWAANLADLELHTSLSRHDPIERPSFLAFDLDPGAPAGIPECCEVALRLRGLFQELGLQSFPKTSGSKGIQVYVPLNVDDVTYAETKPFAKAVAELLEKHDPDLVVSRMTKSLRTGKVLVDWSQNDVHKTTVCVYSLRAKERPTVSTPLAWEEVEAGGELSFDAAAVLERVAERGDEFAPVLSLRQPLPRLG